eukprot:gene27391-33082_t
MCEKKVAHACHKTPNSNSPSHDPFQLITNPHKVLLQRMKESADSEIERLEQKIADVENEIVQVENQIAKIADVEDEIAQVENQIADVEDEIAQVENQIAKVEDEIAQVDGEIKQANGDLRKAAKGNKKLLTQKVQRLIIEKGQLRNEKGQLRSEEGQLRTKKEQLRSEEGQLRAQQLIYLTAGQQQLSGLEEQVASLKVEALLLRTPSHQSSASHFSQLGSIPAGFGHLPLVTTFDPTVWYEEEQRQGGGSRCLHAIFVPSEEEISSSPPFIVHFEDLGLESRSETASVIGIQDLTHDQIKACQLDALQKGGRGSSFGGRKLRSGIATASSFADFNMSSDRLPVMILECKGSEGSLLGAVRQAATEGSNVAAALFECGLDSQDCAVPVAGTNGLLISFGVVFLLKQTFPTFAPLCQPLRHFDQRDQRVITAYFRKMQEHSKSLAAKLESVQKKKRESQTKSGLEGGAKGAKAKAQRKASSDEDTAGLLLAVDEYFCKVLHDEVLDRGLGMFSHPHAAGATDFYPGLDHMIRVLNAVYSDPIARPYAEYPLSLRTPSPGCAEGGDSWASEMHHEYVLIYRDLCHLGFRMGAPHRHGDSDSEALFRAYREALRHAVTCIHNAGVLHGDLYLSNVMWRRREGADSIDIKLIDWDASHLLAEGDFHPVIRTRLEGHYKRFNVEASLVNVEVVFGEAHDLLYLSALDVDYAPEDCELWQQLASSEPSEVNDAFSRLLRRAIAKQGESKAF